MRWGGEPKKLRFVDGDVVDAVGSSGFSDDELHPIAAPSATTPSPRAIRPSFRNVVLRIIEVSLESDSELHEKCIGIFADLFVVELVRGFEDDVRRDPVVNPKR